ncbi:MAG: glycosyltransferase family 4 protein [Woeseia sp.]
MEIGYVYGFNSYPPGGGGGVHVYNLVHNLSSMGHKIHAFEPEQNAQCVTYSTTREGIAAFLEAIDLLYVRIDGSFLSRSDLKLRCLKEIRSKPVVWEVNSPTDETLARLRFEALSYSNLSNPLLEKLKCAARDFSFRLTVRKEERLRRTYAKNIRAAICVSESLKQHAHRDLGISRCEVIPNGSDPAMFSNAKSSNVFEEYADYYKVIYAGASQWFWQGVDVIDELASSARRRGHKILFILLDNSINKSRMKPRPNLLVFDRVDYFDVPGYLAAADACLCLYHDFSWCRYGFYLSPLKLYDYMASGKPVIASRLGQISTVIEDGKDGLLVGDDPDEIYDKILFCRDSGAIAKRLGESAQQKVSQLYNWRRAAESTIKVFESVLN